MEIGCHSYWFSIDLLQKLKTNISQKSEQNRVCLL